MYKLLKDDWFLLEFFVVYDSIVICGLILNVVVVFVEVIVIVVNFLFVGFELMV